MKFAKTLTAAVLAAGLAFSAQAADKMKVAMVVKTLGNGFFDAAHQGADEAAKQLGDVEIIFTGPAKATAEGQIELINSLVAQKVQAMVISANDSDALVPATKKAMARDASKVLASAIANAENNHNLDVDALVVAEASVGKSVTMKRFHTRGRGKSTRILKPFSRLRIVVRESEEA